MRLVALGLISIGIVTILATPGAAQVAKIVPGAVLEAIENQDPEPLPRHLTMAESLVPFPPIPAALVPGAPPGLVDTPAEYEENAGILMRWGYFNDLITAMTVGITTGDPEAIVYIVAQNGYIPGATSTLAGAGADMSQVVFLPYHADSVWIRDYGPRFIFSDFTRGLVDSFYYPMRPLDDAFPGWLGPQWSDPVYDMLVYHSGGNFHPFATAEGFVSSIVLDDNPGTTGADFTALFADFHGVDLTIFPHFPYSFDGTGHIDMWMLPVADDEVIIGEYAPATGSPYTVSEDAVAELLSRGYTIHRVPGWNAIGTHYTYTNAVVFNDIVFVPWYNGYTTQNQEALTVFQTAFPTHQLIQIDCSEIIHYAGAIHCIVMHVPRNPASLAVTPGGSFVASGPVGGPFVPSSIEYVLENSADVPLEYVVGSTTPWLTIEPGTGFIPELGAVTVTVTVNDLALALAADTHHATVSFDNLTDGSGDTIRDVELRIGTMALAHEFPLDANPGWSTTGEWEFGTPLGLGGDFFGGPDPTTGYTGDSVYGVNLGGDYSTAIVTPRYLTTTAIDCSDLAQVEVRFRRWLNTDYQPYAGATFEASTDGASWTMLWQNGGTEITDSSWTPQVFNVSALVDHEPTVYLRWGYSVWTDAYAYSGWNVDDVEIWGVPTGSCSLFRRGDVNLDGALDIADPIALLDYIFAGTGLAMGCDDAADGNDDGSIDVADAITILSALFTSGFTLPPPSGTCGVDPTADVLGCEVSPVCCP